MVDAAQSHSAESVHIVMPYYGYARQDKPDDRRSAVMGMLITDIFKLLLIPFTLVFLFGIGLALLLTYSQYFIIIDGKKHKVLKESEVLAVYE